MKIHIPSLEGLIWTGQDKVQSNNQTNTEQYNGKMPEPFTPEYAKFLGKHAQKVEGLHYGQALDDALYLAGETGFILSTADLMYAREQLRDTTFTDYEPITGLTYEVAGWTKISTDYKIPALLVLHGLDLVKVGVHLLRNSGKDKIKISPQEWEALLKGQFENNSFKLYYPGRQSDSRVFGIQLPFDECTEEYFLKNRENIDTNSGVLSDIQRHERARTADDLIFLAANREIFRRHGVSSLAIATRWKRESFWNRLVNKLGQEYEVKPVTNYTLRNVNSTFNESAAFAVIPDGVIK